MIDVNFNISDLNEDNPIFKQGGESGLYEKLVFVENELVFNFIIDSLVDIQVSEVMVSFTEQVVKDQEANINEALRVLKELQSRKSQLLDLEARIADNLLGVWENIKEDAVSLGGVLSTVAKTFYSVTSSALTFDKDKFIESLVNGSSSIGNSLKNHTIKVVSNFWDSLSKSTEAFAFQLNDLGLNFIGEGLASLGRFINKILETLCDETTLLILDIAVPVVAGVVAGIFTAGTAVAPAVKTSYEAMMLVHTFCGVGQIGSIFFDLQLSNFESALRSEDVKEVEKSIKGTQELIDDINDRAMKSRAEIRDLNDEIENTKRRLILAIASERFFQNLEDEYPILSPKEALKVYFSTLGSLQFSKIINSRVVKYEQIMDLIQVVIGVANEYFGGEKKCPKLEARFESFISNLIGATGDNYCKFISQTQLFLLKSEFDRTFSDQDIVKSMSLKDFLIQHGDRINELTSELFKKKSFLYKNILSQEERSHLYDLMKEAGLNADAIIYGVLEEDFSGSVIPKRSVGWAFASFGIFSYLTFYLYKRYYKGNNH